MPKYPAGTVVRYTPDPSRHDPRWCREGTAIADERGRLIDTYWGTGGGVDAHFVSDVEMPTVKVVFHVGDYDELDRWRPDRKTWEKYAPAYRQRITHQHGLQERLFIRKGAEPDLATQIANAEQKIRDAEADVQSAERALQWARQDLERLTDSAVI